MKFKYVQFPLPQRSELFGSSVLKPIIPIGVTIGDEPFDYSALIDSGADFCIFDAGIAEALNLDITSGTRIGFGGIQEAGVGERGFFDLFVVKFDLLKEEVELVPRKNKKS